MHCGPTMLARPWLGHHGPRHHGPNHPGPTDHHIMNGPDHQDEIAERLLHEHNCFPVFCPDGLIQTFYYG